VRRASKTFHLATLDKGTIWGNITKPHSKVSNIARKDFDKDCFLDNSESTLGIDLPILSSGVEILANAWFKSREVQ